MKSSLVRFDREKVKSGMLLRLGHSMWPVAQFGEVILTDGISTTMLGTSADLIKLSMVEVQRVLDAEPRGTKMIMQVHDELVFEVPEEEASWVRHEIPRIMADVAHLKVPLLAEVGVGPHWEKGH